MKSSYPLGTCPNLGLKINTCIRHYDSFRRILKTNIRHYDSLIKVSEQFHAVPLLAACVVLLSKRLN